MTNSNSSQNQTNASPVDGTTPSMARLRALQNLSRLKSSLSTTSSPVTTPHSTSPVLSPADDQEIDWEELFAASTQKENRNSKPNFFNPSLANDTLETATHNVDNQGFVEDLSFLPPSLQEDNDLKKIQEEISRSLPNASDPKLDDSSDFFSPPFEILTSSELNTQLDTKQIVPTLVDQIRLNTQPLTETANANHLEIVESTNSYPLTLTQDPKNPNPITQMLKKLQGQFGAQISETMVRTRKNIIETIKSYNNKSGDASNLEASLFDF